MKQAENSQSKDGEHNSSTGITQSGAQITCGHPIKNLTYLPDHEDNSQLSGFGGLFGFGSNPGLMFKCEECGEELKVYPFQIMPACVDDHRSIIQMAKALDRLEERMKQLEKRVGKNELYTDKIC